MIKPNYTTKDIIAYRDENGCSVFDAKNHFHKKQILEILQETRQTQNIEHLIDVIEELVARTSFR